MTRCFSYLGIVAAVILCIPCHNAFAQTRGVVIDEAGNPLISVAVEAWNVSGRVAVAITGRDGKFSLDVADKSPSQVIASRLGYSNGYLRYTAADTAVTIRMKLLPVSISPLTVRASSQEVRCPHKEEARARNVWQKARSHYSMDTGDRGLTGEGRFANLPKDRSELGQYESSWLRWFWQGWNAYHYNQLYQLERSTYGLRLETEKGQDDFDRETGEWIYPKLHKQAAYHFASNRFGERHTMFVLSARDDSEVVLGFCPLSKDEPEISGKLAIDSQGHFEWASWNFHTPSPRDDAGGRLVYTAITDPVGGLPHLLPRESIFWRKPEGQKSYEQFVYEFDVWVVSPDRCRPDLSYKDSAERKRGGCSEHFGD